MRRFNIGDGCGESDTDTAKMRWSVQPLNGQTFKLRTSYGNYLHAGIYKNKGIIGMNVEEKLNERIFNISYILLQCLSTSRRMELVTVTSAKKISQDRLKKYYHKIIWASGEIFQKGSHRTHFVEIWGIKLFIAFLWPPGNLTSCRKNNGEYRLVNITSDAKSNHFQVLHIM